MVNNCSNLEISLMSYQMAGILSHENDHTCIYGFDRIFYIVYMSTSKLGRVIFIFFFLNKQGKYIKISYISHKYLKDKKD